MSNSHYFRFAVFSKNLLYWCIFYFQCSARNHSSLIEAAEIKFHHDHEVSTTKMSTRQYITFTIGTLHCSREIFILFLWWLIVLSNYDIRKSTVVSNLKLEFNWKASLQLKCLVPLKNCASIKTTEFSWSHFNSNFQLSSACNGIFYSNLNLERKT